MPIAQRSSAQRTLVLPLVSLVVPFSSSTSLRLSGVNICCKIFHNGKHYTRARKKRKGPWHVRSLATHAGHGRFSVSCIPSLLASLRAKTLFTPRRAQRQHASLMNVPEHHVAYSRFCGNLRRLESLGGMKFCQLENNHAAHG